MIVSEKQAFGLECPMSMAGGYNGMRMCSGSTCMGWKWKARNRGRAIVRTCKGHRPRDDDPRWRAGDHPADDPTVEAVAAYEVSYIRDPNDPAGDSAYGDPSKWDYEWIILGDELPDLGYCGMTRGKP